MTLLVACSQSPTRPSPTEPVMTTENFDWLLGHWQRLNDEEGKLTFESWKKISDIEYAGIGYTLQNSDTISQERMQVIKSNDRWDLFVFVGDETESVLFKGKSHTANQLIWYNKENDFPNHIRYWKNGNQLHASISSDEMEILYEFKKRDQSMGSH